MRSINQDKKNETNLVSKTLGVDKEVSIPLEAKSGSKIVGDIQIFELKEGTVLLRMHAENVTPGLHALHIHENPDCSSKDGSSAGSHWNPYHQSHGRWGSRGGYHQGDIGVVLANKKGQVDYTFKTTTASWCIGCEDPNKNILGHSMILHAQEDDFTTQPTGNAGSRIACGVIR